MIYSFKSLTKPNTWGGIIGFYLMISFMLMISGLPASASREVVSVQAETVEKEITSDTDRVRLLVSFDMQSPYSIQAHNPSTDIVIPTDIRGGSDGVEVLQQIYPDYDLKTLGDPFGEVEVYKDHIVVPVEVQIPTPSAGGDTVEFSIEVKAQACDDDSCRRPATWNLPISLPLANQVSAHEDRQQRFQNLIRERTGETTQEEDKTQEENGTQEQTVRRSPGTNETGGGASASNTSGGIQFLVPREEPDKEPVDVVEDLGLIFGDQQETSTTETSSGGEQPDNRRNLFWFILGAFGWGLVASISPCVYPMIPVTLSYFGIQAEDDEEDSGENTLGKKVKVISLALTFTLGIALTFATLGVVTSLLGVELGAALGNPYFVGGLILLFLFLSLWMMDLVEVPLPSSLNRLGGSKPGYTGSFLMGALLGAVGAPCVGPFAAVILAFIATTGDIVVGFSAMFSFGLGLGMLFLVLAIFSRSFTELSAGSGTWLKNMKIFWGFVVLGVVVYFTNLLFQIEGMDASAKWATPLMAGIIAVLFGYWLFSISPLSTEESTDGAVYLPGAMGRGTGLVALVIGLYFTLGATAQSGLLLPTPDWWQWQDTGNNIVVEDFPTAVNQAREEGKPIFIDFYADWCIPCKQMENNVFSDPEVGTVMNEHFVSIKMDATKSDSFSSRLKKHEEAFHSSAMPLYAFIDKNGRYHPEHSLMKRTSKQEFMDHVRGVLDSFGE